MTSQDPSLPSTRRRQSASLGEAGISPIVTPNTEFYRIDTALLVPRPDIEHAGAAA